MVIKTPPEWTASRYVGVNSQSGEFQPSDFLLNGCVQAQFEITKGIKDSIVILAFGAPRINPPPGSVVQRYGTHLPATLYFVSITKITSAARNYLAGYWNCSQPGMKLTLALGTNNAGNGLTNDVGTDHGQLWAAMIDGIDSWIDSFDFGSRVAIAGAVDFETWMAGSAFADPLDARAWADGYSSVTVLPYYNFGSCDGCPADLSEPPPAPPPGDWSLDDFWYLSWGAENAFPLPINYRTDDYQAQQWRYISYYAATCAQTNTCVDPLNPPSGSTMYFSGSTTQFLACHQPNHEDDPICLPDTNNARDGWLSLFWTLNENPVTAQPSLRWSTDFLWDNP